jgi:hypothetical protein
MKKYLHRVLGLYETHGGAALAREQLLLAGFLPAQLTLLQPGSSGLSRETHVDSDDVRYEILRHAQIGALIGTLIGFAGTVALIMANGHLFDTGPVLGTLIMVGWSASIGGFAGAVIGATGHRGDVADLLSVSLASGHIVLIAHTSSEEQTGAARLILGQSLRHYPAASARLA